MEKDEEESHCCKVCNKIFTNGGSLGGHMRSHLPLDSSFDAGESAGYGLRENPKKSWRVSDSKLLKCSYGNTESESQSDSEMRGAMLLRRRKLKRVAAICDDQEQEDGALILMMMSRGEFEFQKSNFYQFDPATDGFDDYNAIDSVKKGRYKCRTCDKVFNSYQALGGHRASHNVSVVKRLKNKSKDHECPVCGKSFASGQALGGHKRSHWAANSVDFRFQAYDDADENPDPSHCLWI